MSPGDLGQALCGLPPVQDPNVLVGNLTRDDAAVYRLRDDLAVVQTVDVFTPVVDDPYVFGQVAAANALSDIYAMGARPVMALSVIGFPVDKLPISQMQAILRGGVDKAREAGIEVAGGHSLEDSEPKYGLCVTGVVHPDRILRNSTARPGDALVLTKPLGTGVLTHAVKKDATRPGEEALVAAMMAELNRSASEAMVAVGVSACTDVTGFGLLGHLVEMLEGSGVSARLRLAEVPVLAGVREHIRNGIYPGGTKKNLTFFGGSVTIDEGVEIGDRLLLADAQTSGGLLIAVPSARAQELMRALEDRGVGTRARIGEVLDGAPGRVEVVGG